MNAVRCCIALALLLVGGAVAAAQPHGVYTELLFDDCPPQPRRMTWGYTAQAVQFANCHKLAIQAAAKGMPVALNIEFAPHTHEVWRYQTPQSKAARYMGHRAGIAKMSGQPVGVYCAMENGLAHDWKAGNPRYWQRVENAKPMLDRCDFAIVNLYLPERHRQLMVAGESWVLEQWIKRAEGFASCHTLPVMFLIAPQAGGNPGAPLLPAEELRIVVETLVEKGHAVCLWGGQGHAWDVAHPTCRVVAELGGLTQTAAASEK